jgi:ATP/maltotriose-dependent transcriptional regulator MalT
VRADPRAAAAALYQEGEVHRLLGEYAQAEEAYRKASDLGAEPQPGFALLRAAQGRGAAAAAAIRRVLGAVKDGLHRTRYLPAFVEIMLGIGEIEEALQASIELKDIAVGFESDVLDAMAWHAEGAVALAQGNAQAALVPLRRAFNVWQQMEAPYIAARLRVSIGLACHVLGDEDGARLELSGARTAFRELGAAPDLARIDALTKNAKSPHNLTGREQQVLGLVAAGKSNKAIAAQLNLSSKTVDRHVSNIFMKLDVSSRAAATAKAYKQGLV